MDIFSLLFFRVKKLQQRKNFNVPKIIEKGIKHGCFIHGIDHVHLVPMEKVFSNPAVIPLGGVPKKSFAEGIL